MEQEAAKANTYVVVFMDNPENLCSLPLNSWYRYLLPGYWAEMTRERERKREGDEATPHNLRKRKKALQRNTESTPEQLCIVVF